MGEFTVAWFDVNRDHLMRILRPYRGQPGVRMLEIGAYEGRSTVWFLEEILTGEGSALTTIDAWEASREYGKLEMQEVQDRFDRNTQAFVDAGRLTAVVGFSQQFLAARIARRETAPGNGFHIIYVDGSHAAPDVLSDAVLSWALLEPGGVMVFDDYIWSGMTSEQERPRFAIDSFLACFLGQYEELYRGVQVVIRRHASKRAYRGSSALDHDGGAMYEELAATASAAAISGVSRRRRGKRSSQ